MMRCPSCLFASALIATGCPATEVPFEGPVVDVTIRVEGYEGPVALLLSAPDGRYFGIVELVAPNRATGKVPANAMVSTKFGDAPEIYVITDLNAGDDVTLRPFVVGSPRKRQLVIEPIAELAPNTVRIDTGCGQQEVQEAVRTTISVTCRADPLNIGFQRIAPDDTTLGVATLSVTATQGDIIRPPPPSAFTQRMDPYVVEVRNAPNPDATWYVGLRGILGEQRMGLPFVQETILPSERADTSIELFPFDYEATEATVTSIGDDAFEITQISTARPVILDLTPTLPRFENFVANDSGASWVTHTASAGIDLAILAYVMKTTDPGGTTFSTQNWLVAVAPNGSGIWSRPEIPDELEDWLPPNGTFHNAIIYHYDFGDVAASDIVADDPFKRPSSDVSLTERRRAIRWIGVGPN